MGIKLIQILQAFLAGRDCSQLGSVPDTIVPLTRIGTEEVCTQNPECKGLS
jgi:hypothetical protein